MTRVTDVSLRDGLTLHILGDREDIISRLNVAPTDNFLVPHVAVDVDGNQHPWAFSRGWVAFIADSHDLEQGHGGQTPSALASL